MIQRLVLFLGYPTYSLTVTLASLLVFTGVGSLLSHRFAPSAGTVVASCSWCWRARPPSTHGDSIR